MTAVLGVYNRVDASTLTGGSWTSGLPLNNLKTKILGQVARTTNALAASSTFVMDLGDAKKIQVVSVVNHNVSLAGKIRIRASDTNFGTVVYDSGEIDVWPSVYNTIDLEWEDSAYWSGQYTAEEITGYTPTTVHLTTVPVVARYWKVDIIDTTNAVGYIQIGRVFIGPTWTPERDAEVGLSVAWETNTQVQKALNGTKYFQRRNPYRVTRFTLNVLGTDEAMSYAFEIDRRIGIDGEVLWIQNDQDTIHALRRRYLANMRELTAIEFPYSTLARKAYTLEEVV